MGEIADMMVQREIERLPRHQSWAGPRPPKDKNKAACPHCGRHVKSVGLNDHIRAMHAEDKK